MKAESAGASRARDKAQDFCPAQVDLSAFSNQGFDRGASRLKEALWVVVRTILFERMPFRMYGLKRWMLRRFGAKVGKGVVIKPGVRITFPWKLSLGDNVWLGEECWLLNLAPITIEANVCISQRAMLCTGSHDYKSTRFDLIVKPIHVEGGSWVAAAAWVGPGVRIRSHAVVCAGSVATVDLEAYGIYQGIPAKKIRLRRIER